MSEITYSPDKQKKGVYFLSIDGTLWRSFDSRIFPINVLKDLINISTLNQFTDQWQELEIRGAKSYALQKLSKKAYSSKELKKFLRDKLVSEDSTNLVLKNLKEKGFVNDQDWMESFIRVGIAKKLSPRALSEKLKAKGCSKEEIIKALEKNYSEKMKKQILAGLIEKEINRFKAKDTSENRKKIIAKLYRKGFLLQDIYDLLKSNNY